MPTPATFSYRLLKCCDTYRATASCRRLYYSPMSDAFFALFCHSSRLLSFPFFFFLASRYLHARTGRHSADGAASSAHDSGRVAVMYGAETTRDLRLSVDRSVGRSGATSKVRPCAGWRLADRRFARGPRCRCHSLAITRSNRCEFAPTPLSPYTRVQVPVALAAEYLLAAVASLSGCGPVMAAADSSNTAVPAIRSPVVRRRPPSHRRIGVPSRKE